MHQYNDKPMPNEWIMRGILTALQPLELDDFDQTEGDFYWDADGEPIEDPTCPVCVGLRIALDCDLERAVDSDGSAQITFWDGNSHVCLATAMRSTEVDRLLHRHGAPELPFSTHPWEKRPFDVLKNAFEEVLGVPIDLE